MQLLYRAWEEDAEVCPSSDLWGRRRRRGGGSAVQKLDFISIPWKHSNPSMSGLYWRHVLSRYSSGVPTVESLSPSLEQMHKHFLSHSIPLEKISSLNSVSDCVES